MAQTSHQNIAPNSHSTWQEYKYFTLLIFIILLLRTFAGEIFFIPSGSMNDTLLEGDYVLSTKYDYGYTTHSIGIPFVNIDLFPGRIMKSEPKRGDIIIFKSPQDKSIRYVKRVIGLPGDKIEIRKSIVYINDKPCKLEKIDTHTDKHTGVQQIKFKETFPTGFSHNLLLTAPQYLNSDQGRRTAIDLDMQDNYGPAYVPEDHYFFLGDNRHNSGDSRFGIGMVSGNNLIAKGRWIIFSTDERMFDNNLSFTDQFKQIFRWFTQIRFARFFKSIYE